jgi:hypothetical protein
VTTNPGAWPDEKLLLAVLWAGKHSADAPEVGSRKFLSAADLAVICSCKPVTPCKRNRGIMLLLEKLTVHAKHHVKRNGTSDQVAPSGGSHNGSEIHAVSVLFPFASSLPKSG